MMVIPSILSAWRSDPDTGGNFTAWQTVPAVAARWRSIPTGLDSRLVARLETLGIRQLYTHQAGAFEAAQRGENVAVVTGTASGKTLCFNLPVINDLSRNLSARALYIYPTKALAQDQQESLDNLATGLGEAPLLPNIYDGDTPSGVRPTIRAKSRIVLTNPDMLHTGILPHHTIWTELLRNLRFVVIDEMHIYRGVFGSHIANVLRRLQRVARFYGSSPQFILTSATIVNPAELAERLIEQPVTLVDDDGSARGPRHFIIYNPPVVDKALGMRKSAMLESVRLASELVERGAQTIIFGRTRRTVEKLLTYLRERLPGDSGSIRGYRSGYLRSERRAIEQGLRSGEVRAVVATSALELGIDIGGMSAAVLAGYPGTIAAARQQAGRAGRTTDASLAVMVATPDALDQFLARHPEYFFGRSPEQALIHPDNLLILLAHLRCAAFELSFKHGESFGRVPPELVAQFMTVLQDSGVVHQGGERYFWMADQYPANEVSLRSASPDNVILEVENEDGLSVVGQVDRASALWMVHPNAIYLHEGQSYLVETLDLEKGLAHMRAFDPGYYTDPMQDVSVEGRSVLKQETARGCLKTYGDLLVTSKMTGYKRVRWTTYETLGIGELDLPPTELYTTGYWLTVEPRTVEMLRSLLLWSNDPNEYGPDWDAIRALVRRRDGFKCQVCGLAESGRAHYVHHKQPFRSFTSVEAANHPDNLITLCPSCHRRVEQAVRIRSGLAGVAYALYHLSPFFLMCDVRDLGVHSDPQSPLSEGQPTVVIYDNIPAGIGLSERLFDFHDDLLARAYETVAACECDDGCPSCIGPSGESMSGSKRESLALFAALTGQDLPPGKM